MLFLISIFQSYDDTDIEFQELSSYDIENCIIAI